MSFRVRFGGEPLFAAPLAPVAPGLRKRDSSKRNASCWLADLAIREHGISARVWVAFVSGVIRGPALVRMGNSKQIALL